MMILKNNKARHLLRVWIALLLVYLSSYFFYPNALTYMLVSTLFVMLTTMGSAFFQGLTRFFTLVAMVMMGHFVCPHLVSFYKNLDAMVFGSVVGIMTNTLIFADRVDLAFKNKVIPLLKASQHYFSTLVDGLLNAHVDDHQQAKSQVENAFIALPVWIYKPGFDLGLQKGYRYYFMQLAHLVEVLFAMQYITRKCSDVGEILCLESALLQCKRGVAEFIEAIIVLLNLEKLKEGVLDFGDHIDDMEFILRKHMPVSLEFLEMESRGKYLAEFVYKLRELRVVLIQLAKALR